MKKSLILFSFLTFILVSTLVGAAANLITGMNPLTAATVYAVGKIIYSSVTNWNIGPILMAGVNKEIWIEKLKENFYSEYPWLDGVDDWSEWVEYNTINFTVAGANPTILKNNAVWPIVAAQRTDTNSTVVLDTYDSTTTRVRNTEEIESSISKLESVVKQHRQSLMQEIVTECLWNYAPATLALGAFSTTGALRPAVIGSQSTVAKTLAIKDVATLQERWDVLQAPQQGRVLVLSTYHRTDLMNADTTLFKEFTNLKTGEALDMFGIKVYTVANTPLYTKATLAKKAYGAAADNTNDCVASVGFIQDEVMKCEGDMEMFFRAKADNPDQRSDEVGFQMRFKGVPQRTTTANLQMAIVSDRA